MYLESMPKTDSFSSQEYDDYVKQVEDSKRECIEVIAKSAEAQDRIRILYENDDQIHQKEEMVAQSIEFMKIELLKGNLNN